MGLDIIAYSKSGEELYDFRAGSYSGFMNFRLWLADVVAGVVLSKMRGFKGNQEWKKDTSFLELLNHSDCEGKLTYTACKNLLKDFEDEKVQKALMLENLKVSDGNTEWHLEKLDDWKKAIELVVKHKGYIIFC